MLAIEELSFKGRSVELVRLKVIVRFELVHQEIVAQAEVKLVERAPGSLKRMR